MNLTIHTATIDFRNGYVCFSSTVPDDLQNQIAAYCRENWANSFAAGDPLPSHRQALIEHYLDNSEDGLQESISTLALPEPYASAPELLTMLQDVADTPKHGESERCDPEYPQDWEAEMGRHAIGRLHELIDSARAVIAKVAVPSVPHQP